jgi:hypothetical protein
VAGTGPAVVTEAFKLVASLARGGLEATEGQGKSVAAAVLAVLTISPETGHGEWHIQPGWSVGFGSDQESKMLRDLSGVLLERAGPPDPLVKVYS